MKKTERIYQSLMESISEISEDVRQYATTPTAFTRNRKLPMKKVVETILSMGGGTLQRELYELSKIGNQEIVTSSAFVQQRSKISPQAFQDLFYRFNEKCDDKNTWNGYRLLAVDGTDIDFFRNPESECFISNDKDSRGYCKMHVNALYDIQNKVYVDAYLQARTKFDERFAVAEMMRKRKFEEKTIIIADRGYEGYNLFAHFLNTKNVDFVCRVRHGIGCMRDIKNLPMQELDIDIFPEITTTQTKEDKKHKRILHQPACPKGKNPDKISRWDHPSPYVLGLRIVRFEISPGIFETIATSLNREEFSIQEIKELYNLRWGIEISFRELKYVVGLVRLHCKKESLVVQEIFSALTMYNYSSRITSCVSEPKKTIKNHNNNIKHSYKINYTMAAHLCKMYFRLKNTDFDQLLIDISNYVEPIRKGRTGERRIQKKGFCGFSYRV